MHSDAGDKPETSTLREDASRARDWRLARFPNLMPRRVREILLVASAYDSFILEEDGLLTELIFAEYSSLGLTRAPRVTRVTNADEALAALGEASFDLVITMPRAGNMNVQAFGRSIHELAPAIPVVLLVATEWELARLIDDGAGEHIDSLYLWHGDAKLFLAIIKVLEDRWNAEHDTRIGDVGVIILIEDSVHFRSSLLPIIYAELVSQMQSVMADGTNRMHRIMRLRARPKVLVAETFEHGMELFTKYRENLFGVIADVRFPRAGELDPRAGLDFISQVKSEEPDLPALLQSSDAGNRSDAEAIGAWFLHKHSSTLLQDVREFMLVNFGFGDFVFRMPDNREVARAADLRAMARRLNDVPAESLHFHASRNHFSNWLRARTEFVLARRLRAQPVADFNDMGELRRYLRTAFGEALSQNRQGVVEEFSRGSFDPGTRFARIAGGSLGGKARGLAFMDSLLLRSKLDDEFSDVRVCVPPSVAIATDAFDQFLEQNRLRLLALRTGNDDWLRWAFLTADVPENLVSNLRAYLDTVRQPIAVRSSSLLEDSQYHPFAGIYATYMIPNNHPDERVRLTHLCDAIKLVYASTFLTAARRYLEATPHRIEEEKMAVLLQPVVGSRHGHHFYPNFAGVARSYNFYPFGHMRPEEGVASVALGLGTMVADGGEALRFCPVHPHVLPQLAMGEEFLNQSQRGFFALDLSHPDCGPGSDRQRTIVRLELDQAEEHGTLAAVGSVWSEENNAFYDGIYRPGVRVVTFAHVLKSDLFPLAPILARVLELGREGMGCPVEVEFAAALNTEPKEFAILQIRPYVAGGDSEQIDLGNLARNDLMCESPLALGNGVISDVRDIIYVKPDAFDAGKTAIIAREVGKLNDRLHDVGRPCVLIGPGRWGSSNHWLGIPVQWEQICTARVIVETSLENFMVDPSQGSHFFQNLTALGIAYLTVNPRSDGGFVDWEWLSTRKVESDSEFVRHIRLDEPLETRIDGRSSRAAILKSALPSVEE